MYLVLGDDRGVVARRVIESAWLAAGLGQPPAIPALAQQEGAPEWISSALPALAGLDSQVLVKRIQYAASFVGSYHRRGVVRCEDLLLPLITAASEGLASKGLEGLSPQRELFTVQLLVDVSRWRGSQPCLWRARKVSCRALTPPCSRSPWSQSLKDSSSSADAARGADLICELERQCKLTSALHEVHVASVRWLRAVVDQLSSGQGVAALPQQFANLAAYRTVETIGQLRFFIQRQLGKSPCKTAPSVHRHGSHRDLLLLRTASLPPACGLAPSTGPFSPLHPLPPGQKSYWETIGPDILPCRWTGAPFPASDVLDIWDAGMPPASDELDSLSLLALGGVRQWCASNFVHEDTYPVSEEVLR